VFVPDDPRKGKRPPTFGDRNEHRRTPQGVPVEFASEARQITGVHMLPEQEIAERVERARSATKSSEIAVMNRLSQQDGAIAAVTATVGTVQIDVAQIKGELLGIRPLVVSLQKTADRLADRDDLHFRASIQVDTAQQIGGVEVDKAQRIGVVKSKLLRGELGIKLVALFSAVVALAMVIVEASHC
jgi:hypothetical protein